MAVIDDHMYENWALWKKRPKPASWLCKGWKVFYDHALPGFMDIAAQLAKRKQQEQ